MIVWILLGLGLIASKIISTTGEGTVVDILLGVVGALAGGWLFSLFSGTNVNGFDIDSVYGPGVAVVDAIILLALYHVFLRRRMRDPRLRLRRGLDPDQCETWHLYYR
jgi:uncharacterized membrane protein YeaQ/YmgE (transglycosylase-associated protein family)